MICPAVVILLSFCCNPIGLGFLILPVEELKRLTLVRSVRYWAKRYAFDKQLYMLES
mgnify:FL=1